MAKKRFAQSASKASRTVTISRFRIRTYELPPPGFNPLTAAPRLLQRYGLPKRPDAKSAPELLKSWEAAFAGPRTWITPEFREMKGKYHGPARRPRQQAHLKRAGVSVANATSENWSGSVAFPPVGQTFTWVAGQWTVPNPYPPGLGQFYASEWIGIDGWKSGDVLQAGTETQVVNLLGKDFSARVVYAWWEWYPAYEVAITNLPVSPGDIMSCLIHVNSISTASVIVQNQSSNVTTLFTITAPSGTTLVGESAEWIVERPTVNKVLTKLADYKVDYFDYGFAGTTNISKFVTLGLGTAVTMKANNGASLSVPTLEGVTLMKVNWLKAN
jgi:hypothetical protein